MNPIQIFQALLDLNAGAEQMTTAIEKLRTAGLIAPEVCDHAATTVQEQAAQLGGTATANFSSVEDDRALKMQNRKLDIEQVWKLQADAPIPPELLAEENAEQEPPEKPQA